MIKPSVTETRSALAALALAASTLVGIALHEGYKDQAYIPVAGDVPTIGFGTTNGVRLGDRTTPERSLVRLLGEVEDIYVAGIKSCVTAPLYPHEFEAFVTLAYNIGVPTFCRKAKPGNPPNLIDLINNQQYAEACARIEAFRYGPGRKVLPGLVKRRAEERATCEGKKSREPSIAVSRNRDLSK
jgi:lysozyme